MQNRQTKIQNLEMFKNGFKMMDRKEIVQGRGMCEERTKTAVPVDKISAKSGRECRGGGLSVHDGSGEWT